MTQEDIDRVILALTPFAAFNNGGRVWHQTAWEHKGGDESVVFDHKSNRCVTKDDFARAEHVLRLLTL